MSGTDHRPRYAYENPADLAWGAQMIRTGLRRKRLRLAAQEAAQEPRETHEDAPSPPNTGTGGPDDA